MFLVLHVLLRPFRSLPAGVFDRPPRRLDRAMHVQLMTISLGTANGRTVRRRCFPLRAAMMLKRGAATTLIDNAKLFIEPARPAGFFFFANPASRASDHDSFTAS